MLPVLDSIQWVFKIVRRLRVWVWHHASGHAGTIVFTGVLSIDVKPRCFFKILTITTVVIAHNGLLVPPVHGRSFYIIAATAVCGAERGNVYQPPCVPAQGRCAIKTEWIIAAFFLWMEQIQYMLYIFQQPNEKICWCNSPLELILRP